MEFKDIKAYAIGLAMSHLQNDEAPLRVKVASSCLLIRNTIDEIMDNYDVDERNVAVVSHLSSIQEEEIIRILNDARDKINATLAIKVVYDDN